MLELLTLLLSLVTVAPRLDGEPRPPDPPK